ncbi:hypothetical protein BKA70DRAFT_1307213 [Coprinopsis sp. MPI-PUGE-AT-0042]|nr:hypothetical protein BKA70DRAFT_1307213 [Coprinopsis sp. MPI-PUGE-AT-0042]
MADVYTYTSIAQISSEIWAIVFRLALGPNPFGPDERRAYNRLRQVCAMWRRVVATTPDLCSGIAITSGSFACPFDKEVFRTRFLPWLSIIRQNQPYHLVLGRHWHWDVLNKEQSTSLARYLLCEATPTPTTFRFFSSQVFEGTLSMTGSCESVIDLKAECEFQDLDNHNIQRLPVVFPKLESFTARARFTLTKLFTCPNLQSLTLFDIHGQPEDFARLCMGMPRLRELKISSVSYHEDSPPRITQEIPFVHPTLETLLVIGQDHLAFTTHLTLPSLKFFGLLIWPRGDNDSPVLKNTLPDFFQRSRPVNLSVSLKGQCDPDFFAAFTRIVPPNTTLLLKLGFYDDTVNEEIGQRSSPAFDFSNIKEMACFDRQYLHECRDHSSCDRAVTVHVPIDILGKEELEPLKKAMRGKGFILEQCLPQIVEDILGSSISPMLEEWMSYSSK